MASKKSRKASSSSSCNAQAKRKRTAIPQAFQTVSSATVAKNGTEIRVPMLVIYGEWLKDAGFPIGASAYLVSDQKGEIVASRFGLRRPRKLTVRAMPR